MYNTVPRFVVDNPMMEQDKPTPWWAWPWKLTARIHIRSWWLTSASEPYKDGIRLGVGVTTLILTKLLVNQYFDSKFMRYLNTGLGWAATAAVIVTASMVGKATQQGIERAATAAVIVTASMVGKATQQGIERSAGAIIGGLLAVGLSWPDRISLLVVCTMPIIIAATVIGALYKFEFKLAAILYIGVVLDAGTADPSTLPAIWASRIIGTLVGVLVAFLTSILIFPRSATQLVIRNLSAAMQAVSDLHATSWEALDAQRAHEQELEFNMNKPFGDQKLTQEEMGAEELALQGFIASKKKVEDVRKELTQIPGGERLALKGFIASKKKVEDVRKELTQIPGGERLALKGFIASKKKVEDVRKELTQIPGGERLALKGFIASKKKVEDVRKDFLKALQKVKDTMPFTCNEVYGGVFLGKRWFIPWSLRDVKDTLLFSCNEVYSGVFLETCKIFRRLAKPGGLPRDEVDALVMSLNYMRDIVTSGYMALAGGFEVEIVSMLDQRYPPGLLNALRHTMQYFLQELSDSFAELQLVHPIISQVRGLNLERYGRCLSILMHIPDRHVSDYLRLVAADLQQKQAEEAVDGLLNEANAKAEGLDEPTPFARRTVQMDLANPEPTVELPNGALVSVQATLLHEMSQLQNASGAVWAPDLSRLLPAASTSVQLPYSPPVAASAQLPSMLPNSAFDQLYYTASAQLPSVPPDAPSAQLPNMPPDAPLPGMAASPPASTHTAAPTSVHPHCTTHAAAPTSAAPTPWSPGHGAAQPQAGLEASPPAFTSATSHGATGHKALPNGAIAPTLGTGYRAAQPQALLNGEGHPPSGTGYGAAPPEALQNGGGQPPPGTPLKVLLPVNGAATPKLSPRPSPLGAPLVSSQAGASLPLPPMPPQTPNLAVSPANQTSGREQHAGQANQTPGFEQHAGQANQTPGREQHAGQANQTPGFEQHAGQANQTSGREQHAGQANQTPGFEQHAGQANQTPGFERIGKPAVTQLGQDVGAACPPDPDSVAIKITAASGEGSKMHGGGVGGWSGGGGMSGDGGWGGVSEAGGPRPTASIDPSMKSGAGSIMGKGVNRLQRFLQPSAGRSDGGHLAPYASVNGSTPVTLAPPSKDVEYWLTRIDAELVQDGMLQPCPSTMGNTPEPSATPKRGPPITGSTDLTNAQLQATPSLVPPIQPTPFPRCPTINDPRGGSPQAQLPPRYQAPPTPFPRCPTLNASSPQAQQPPRIQTPPNSLPRCPTIKPSSPRAQLPPRIQAPHRRRWDEPGLLKQWHGADPNRLTSAGATPVSRDMQIASSGLESAMSPFQPPDIPSSPLPSQPSNRPSSALPPRPSNVPSRALPSQLSNFPSGIAPFNISNVPSSALPSQPSGLSSTPLPSQLSNLPSGIAPFNISNVPSSALPSQPSGLPSSPLPSQLSNLPSSIAPFNISNVPSSALPSQPSNLPPSSLPLPFSNNPSSALPPQPSGLPSNALPPPLSNLPPSITPFQPSGRVSIEMQGPTGRQTYSEAVRPLPPQMIEEVGHLTSIGGSTPDTTGTMSTLGPPTPSVGNLSGQLSGLLDLHTMSEPVIAKKDRGHLKFKNTKSTYSDRHKKKVNSVKKARHLKRTPSMMPWLHMQDTTEEAPIPEPVAKLMSVQQAPDQGLLFPDTEAGFQGRSSSDQGLLFPDTRTGIQGRGLLFPQTEAGFQGRLMSAQQSSSDQGLMFPQTEAGFQGRSSSDQGLMFPQTEAGFQGRLRWTSARFAMQSLFEEGARLRQATNDLLTLLPQLEANQLLGLNMGDEDDLEGMAGMTNRDDYSIREEEEQVSPGGVRRRNKAHKKKEGVIAEP
eukprot:gene25753-11417_t